LKGVRAEKERQVTALEKAVDLALLRYDQGIATYLDVLNAEQQLFPARLDLARTARDQLIAVVLLYRALGGGWNLDVAQWASAGGPPSDGPAEPPDGAGGHVEQGDP